MVTDDTNPEPEDEGQDQKPQPAEFDPKLMSQDDSEPSKLKAKTGAISHAMMDFLRQGFAALQRGEDLPPMSNEVENEVKSSGVDVAKLLVDAVKQEPVSEAETTSEVEPPVEEEVTETVVSGRASRRRRAVSQSWVDNREADKQEAAKPKRSPPQTVNLPASSTIIPSKINLEDVMGYPLNKWPSPEDGVPYTPYHVGVSVLDNSIIPYDEIPEGVPTFVDTLPEGLEPGELAYCTIHWRDCVIAIRSLNFTAPETMIEFTGACYLLPNGNALKTSEWQNGPGHRIKGAKGEPKANAFMWKGRGADQQTTVCFGNSTCMRIELAHKIVQTAEGRRGTAVDFAAAAFAGAQLPMPLVLRTGLGGSPHRHDRMPTNWYWYPSVTNLAEFVQDVLKKGHTSGDAWSHRLKALSSEHRLG